MLDRPTLLSFEYFGDHQFSQRPGTFNDSARCSPGVCFSPCSGLAFIWSPECGSAWATVANIRPVDGIISVFNSLYRPMGNFGAWQFAFILLD